MQIYVFDIYESPSIKHVKQKDRGDIETEHKFCIGPRLKIPSPFNELLKVSSFKSSFLDLLMKEYENVEYASVIEEKEFYWPIDNKCTKFYCVEGSWKFGTIPELFGDHFEGDTRVMFYAKHADIKGPGNNIIRGNNTDIFIILLTNIQKFSQSYLWFDRGLDSDNSRNYVNISKLFKELYYVKDLPGTYAYTGIDYLHAFHRKGKVRPLLLITKKQKFVDPFVALGNLDLSEKIIADIEEFSCHIYGYRKNKCINDVLKAEFDKKCKPNPAKNPLDFIKSFDSATLPPCSKVVL